MLKKLKDLSPFLLAIFIIYCIFSLLWVDSHTENGQFIAEVISTSVTSNKSSTRLIVLFELEDGSRRSYTVTTPSGPVTTDSYKRDKLSWDTLHLLTSGDNVRMHYILQENKMRHFDYTTYFISFTAVDFLN